MVLRKTSVVVLGLLLAIAASNWAPAQTSFPSKPIRIIVPFAAGGSVDIVPRLVAERLPAILGQHAIVENRPGAGGNVGAEAAFNAAPDGYTLLVTPMPLLTVNPHLYKDLRYDPEKFAPVTMFVRYPNVMLARADLPISNVEELIAYAKKHPNKLTYASQGLGTISHATFAWFMHEAGIEMVHVPYRGSGPALNDLIAGHVDVMVENLVGAKAGLDSGRIKLLGVGGDKRIAAFPNVPTISEAVPGFVSNSWIGLVAPPGTPAELTAKLSQAIAKALAEPAIRQRLEELRAEPVGNSPDEMRAQLERETKAWGEIIRRANITL
jgi:tripartite-type tricarboxylate transporter receptor subunit TctC